MPIKKVMKLYGDGEHDDTAGIQAGLDLRGEVVIPEGKYCISNSLVVGDDTALILSFGAEIFLADGACCFMLKNEGCGKEKTNRRITVEGGIWNGNNRAQKRGKIHQGKPYFMGPVMRFENVEDLNIRNLTVKDPESYAMQITGADRFTVENISFDFNMLRPNMDGVHIQGRARNGFIRNIKGATNDDLVALNCDDAYDDGNNLGVKQGIIENISIDGLYADNGYTAVRLLSCGSPMKNVSVRNIFGTYRFYGISFTHHNIVPGAPSLFDGISIENVFCSKHPQQPDADRRFIDSVDIPYGKGTHEKSIKFNPVIWFAEGIRCGNVSISGVYRNEEADTEAPTIQIDRNVVIEHLVLNDIHQKFTRCPEIPLIKNAGEVKEMLIR